MHSLYLSHLVEIADGSRHALAINSRICAAFCILPVYNQLLAVEQAYSRSSPCHYQHNCHSQYNRCAPSACLFWVSFTRSQLATSMPSCTIILLEPACCPAAIVLNYSVHNIQNDVQQIIYNIYIYEKSQQNRLVWGSLTLAQIMISLQWILSERISLNIAHLANQNNTQIHTQYEMTFLTQYTLCSQGVHIREVPLTDIQ